MNFPWSFHKIRWISQKFSLNTRNFHKHQKKFSHYQRNFPQSERIFHHANEIFPNIKRDYCLSQGIFFSIERNILRFQRKSQEFSPNILVSPISTPTFFSFLLEAFIKKLFRFVCSTSLFLVVFYLECQLKNENASNSLHEKKNSSNERWENSVKFKLHWAAVKNFALNIST